MSDRITRKYEARHLKAIKRYQNQVKDTYVKAIDKIFKGSYKLKSSTFKISDYPLLEKQLTTVLAEFRQDLTVILVNGTREQWDLADEKTDEILSNHIAGRTISEQIKTSLYQRNEKASEAFTKRKIKGLKLSDRVWKYTNQFRNEIEQGLYVGISEGTPAAVMAREQKQYLQQPDKLFRRVKNAAGKLVLSKAAKEYHPGKGVYRSSFKNALRLTRTETNDAYRSADFERWNAIPFVIGIEIKLSNNHPRHDICDYLVGTYPAEYKHRGFHAQCLCYAVPKLAKPEDFDKYEDAVLSGKDDNYQFDGTVTKVPASTLQWMKDNKDKISEWKSKPYFIQDNIRLLM